MMKMISRRRLALALGAVSLALAATTATAAADVPFDFEPASPPTFTQAGTGANAAGGHPDVSFAFRMQTDPAIGAGRAAQAPKTAVIELPSGLVGDPNAAAAVCPMEDVVANERQETAGRCPREAAVGIATIDATYPNGSLMVTQRRRLFRVAAGPNEAAAFATSIVSVPIRIAASVSPSGGYRIRATADALPQSAIVRSFDVTLWGVPAEMQGPGPECDGILAFGMSLCLDFQPIGTTPAITFGSPLPGAVKRPFITNPSVCGARLDASLRLVPYGTVFSPIDAAMSAGNISDCSAQPFAPAIDVTPSNRVAGQPSGYTVGIDVPQSLDAADLGTAHVKDVQVTLPEGVAISAPSGNGLDACTDAQLDLNGDSDPACPEASKIGQLTIKTPVLEDPVRGSAYLGTQLSKDPMSGEMYRLFLVAKTSGVLVKLKGAIKADPVTGQLTATFENNPQLPFDRMELRLDHGNRASLANPKACGTYTAKATLTSWAGQTSDVTSSFVIDEGCPTGQFAPTMTAGTANPIAGISTPFSLVVAREDGMKELRAIKSVRLPEGLLGRVGSVPLCGEAQATAGTCGEASRVGHVQAALGSGSSPLWVPEAGKEPTAVFLSGPYRGAPYSLSIVVPAQAGPFDLGRVVVRSALHVDERTAAITTGVDETRLIDTDGTVTEVLPGALPRILKGIVLNQREIRVILDRDDFMVNPTDCSLKEITAEIYSVDGDRADVGNRFRAADCALLGFKPKFRARILDKGRRSTLRSFHPRTRFAVVPRKGDANIGGARVVLPSSTLLDQANIGTTCTRAQMAERKCPEASIVGYAKAWSPLLREVVEGPVYLAANGGVRPLPDLAAVLDGEIRVVLQGEISTQRSGGKARLQNLFRVVPDAPVSRFVLTMRGGKKRGLLVNSTDLCRSKERGVGAFIGQNNRRSRTAFRLTPSFKGCVKVRRQAARKAAARKAAARKAARRKATQR